MEQQPGYGQRIRWTDERVEDLRQRADELGRRVDDLSRIVERLAIVEAKLINVAEDGQQCLSRIDALTQKIQAREDHQREQAVAQKRWQIGILVMMAVGFASLFVQIILASGAHP